MKPTQTGIAVALALGVVVLFFILPGFFPFGLAAPANEPAALEYNQELNMPTDTGELQIRDDVVGTGAVAEAGDNVTVTYVGSLTNGQVFDASANHKETENGFPFTLGAGAVIRGWDQGVAGMKEGGKRTLVIPPELAYGENGVGDVIPPNATLVFQVELLKVEKGAR